MSQIHCKVVQDLMPLVLDRVASEESRGLVEEHMASCGECRKQYDGMKADMPEETRAVYEEEQRNIVRALKEARKKKQTRRILRIVLPVVISLAVLIGGVLLYSYFYVWESVPLENNLYTLSLVQLENGDVELLVESYYPKGMWHMEDVKAMDNGEPVEYMYFIVPPVHSAEKKTENRYKGSFSTIRISERTTEIRQGSEDNYITIWKKGETIPEASEELEALHAFREEFWPQSEWGWNFPEDEEKWEQYNQRMEELYEAVPEWH